MSPRFVDDGAEYSGAETPWELEQRRRQELDERHGHGTLVACVGVAPHNASIHRTPGSRWWWDIDCECGWTATVEGVNRKVAEDAHARHAEDAEALF